MNVAAKKSSSEQKGPGFFEQITIGLTAIGNEIYKNSYIFTNITMMVSFFIFIILNVALKLLMFFLFH